MNQLNKLKILALTMWVGGLFVIGGLVAPVLFYKSGLTSIEAGKIAGLCFDAQTILDFACAAIVFFIFLIEKKGKLLRQPSFWVLLVLVVCVVANQYGITPIIEHIKQTTLPDANGRLGKEFAKWHGISSSIYWFEALLATGLLWSQIPEKNRRGRLLS